MDILFVDDDPEDYQIFREALQEAFPANIQYRYVNDGQRALSMLDDLAVLPDYIFLDVNMPRMGGRDCLLKIKTHSRFKDIRVIMYSTSINPAEIRTFKKLGAEFITKPNTFDALVGALKSVVREV